MEIWSTQKWPQMIDCLLPEVAKMFIVYWWRRGTVIFSVSQIEYPLGSSSKTCIGYSIFCLFHIIIFHIMSSKICIRGMKQRVTLRALHKLALKTITNTGCSTWISTQFFIIYMHLIKVILICCCVYMCYIFVDIYVIYLLLTISGTTCTDKLQ